MAPAETAPYHARMIHADEPTREQMTDAMQAIRNQLELLRSGPIIGGPSNDRSVIADLEAEYQALSEARANLGPGER